MAVEIGVHPLDGDACKLRDWMVEDGTLAWVTSEGRPVSRGGIGKTSKPLLVRSMVRAGPVSGADAR